MGYEGHSPCFPGTYTLVKEKELQTLTTIKAEGTVVTEVVCKGVLWKCKESIITSNWENQGGFVER